MSCFDQLSPLYTVYFYTDFLYRVVRFNRSRADFVFREAKDHEDESSERFLQSYSRSRSMVLQYALCNDWDFFVTITVNPDKFDRYELEPIYSSLYAFFKSYSREYSSSFRFLLVPELHKDGAWHFHGLMSGILPQHLSEFVPGLHPFKLIRVGYLNWGMLASAIGYVSLSRLRSPVGAGFYVAKYITKEHANNGFYAHLYYHSQGLKTARPVADCYVYNGILDQCLSGGNNFCSVGWFKLDSPDFTFPLSLDGCLSRAEAQLTLFDDLVLSSAPEDVPFQPVQLELDAWRLQ